MVTTAEAYSNIRYRASTGQGYDGVVRVRVGDYYGSGSLLYDGMTILTAAHLFERGSASIQIIFDTASGQQQVSAALLSRHTAYSAEDDNADLALVRLAAPAPYLADRYSLYRESETDGETMRIVGYGIEGMGNGGTVSNAAAPVRRTAENRIDGDIGVLRQASGSAMDWSPLTGTQFFADFDNGSPGQDASGRLAYRPDFGLGPREGLISPGDSGGPAFLDGKLAGVASYTTNLSMDGITPDIDSRSNSSFGEIAAWQRVSYYQQWIDQTLRENYPGAPTSSQEVDKDISEGDNSTCFVYFLLQFTGERSDPSQALSVDYATRDGTATAAQDYIAVHGTLVLYPNETHATIPVEIVGDTTAERDETFYLDVTNPLGGSFGEGVVTLTAVRTIVNDDGPLIG